MKIFVGYGYDDRDKWIEENVFDLIRAFGGEPVSGKEIFGQQLEEGVRQKIRECDAFLGFTTRRDKLQNGKYTTHRWVTDEIVAAGESRIPFLEVRETDVDPQGGMPGGRQHVIFDPERKEKCLVAIALAISKWRPNTPVKLQVLPEQVAAKIRPVMNKKGFRCCYRILNESVDYDFFGNRHFDPGRLNEKIPFLSGARITQQEPNTLSVIIDRNGPVKVSFFGVPGIRRLQTPHRAPDNGLQIASLFDLAGTKAAVVQQRAEAKDYRDIDAILQDGRIDLPMALACARAIYGQTFNPQITLKALSFFGDGNLSRLPQDVQDRLVKAAREVDLDKLPEIATMKRGPDPGPSR